MKNIINMKQLLTILLITSIFIACNEEDEDLNKDISVPVSVMDVQLKSIEKYISTTGTVNPLKEVTLKAEISGKYRLLRNPVTGKPYALGDYIKSGRNIIILEDKEYVNNLKVNSLKLRLEISKQTLDKFIFSISCSE